MKAQNLQCKVLELFLKYIRFGTATHPLGSKAANLHVVLLADMTLLCTSVGWLSFSDLCVDFDKALYEIRKDLTPNHSFGNQHFYDRWPMDKMHVGIPGWKPKITYWGTTFDGKMENPAASASNWPKVARSANSWLQLLSGTRHHL